MTSENPLGKNQNPLDSTFGSPYLPPQSMDPGIPGKWRRPSIRERGLLIWILVFSILGIFTVNSDNGDAYSGAYNAVQDAMGWEYPNDPQGLNLDGYLTRTALEAFETEAGVVVYTIVTNSGVRAQSLYDIVIEGVPEGVTPEYITGPLSILGGEARVLAALLPEKTKLSDVELVNLAFSEAKAPDQTTIYLGDVLEPDEVTAKELARAYEPIARQQFEDYLKR